MNAWLSPIRDYWTTRSAREQILLAAMAGLVSVLVIILGIVQPLLSFRNQAMVEFQAALNTHLATVENIERWTANAASAPESGSDTRSLQTIVAEQARQTGLVLSRVQPLENDQLGVWADNVPETVLMQTLIQLKSDKGLHIQRITMNRSDEGLVRTQFLLSRSP